VRRRSATSHLYDRKRAPLAQGLAVDDLDGVPARARAERGNAREVHVLAQPRPRRRARGAHGTRARHGSARATEHVRGARERAHVD
jgi:hypothetical protein